MIIKQALGYGVLEVTKPLQEEPIKLHVDFLETLLTPLQPTKQPIRRKLEKTVCQAVDLANAMACEQALYQWRMVPIGSVAEKVCVEWSDIDQKGHVFLCTFPMCLKEVRDDDGQKQICLVKADVELEHVLGNILNGSSKIIRE